VDIRKSGSVKRELLLVLGFLNILIGFPIYVYYGFLIPKYTSIPLLGVLSIGLGLIMIMSYYSLSLIETLKSGDNPE